MPLFFFFKYKPKPTNMILVNNQPLDISKKKIPGTAENWYFSELEKIQNKKEPIVIKKLVAYRLDAAGKRHKPPLQGVQSRQVISTERGMEMWACCNSYKKEKDETYSYNPNFYFLQSAITLDPKTQSELIFFFTSVANLTRYGYVIDNPEKEAALVNQKDLAELDVKYAIQRRIEGLEELRFIAKSWGLTAADKMGVEQLRLKLFETVKTSEKNITTTKRGYKEFMDDVFNTAPEITEMRALVNMAIDKGILKVDRITRKCSYTPTGDTICIVPLDNRERANDFVAETLLKDKNKDLSDTIRLDVFGEPPAIKLSVADIESLKTRDELKRAAKKFAIVVPPAMKDETIRSKLITAVQE